MAFLLSSPSSSSISHKLSFTKNVSNQSSVCCSLIPIRRQKNPTSARWFIHSKLIFPKITPSVSSEITNCHKLTTLCTSTLEDQMKKFGTAISVFVIFVQLTSSLPLPGWASLSVSPANAVLFSPETKLPRTGELALRKAIPANTNMKTIQDSLEDISYLLRIPQRKPFGTMEGNVKKALKIAKDEKEAILASVPADFKDKGLELYTSLVDGKGGLQSLLGYIKDKDPDRVSVGLASSLDTVAELELLQVIMILQQILDHPKFRIDIFRTLELLKIVRGIYVALPLWFKDISTDVLILLYLNLVSVVLTCILISLELLYISGNVTRRCFKA